MQTGFSEDQEQFRVAVARFMHDQSPVSAVRNLIEDDTGYDSGVWKLLCQELGLAGTHIAESYGGFGFGPVELGVAMEEMGRHLYCGPFLSSAVMAGYALSNGATEAGRLALLPDIASGELIATLVLDSLNDPESLGAGLTVNESSQLEGVAPIVPDAQNAALFVVVARDGNELGLFTLSPEEKGVTVSPLESLDPTRRIGSVVFRNASAERIGTLTSYSLNRMWDEICVALAHEMIGGAQHLLDSTVEYTKVRVQFGRPIGSFQALKHRCADLLMNLEFARAAVHHAAFCLASDECDPWVASMAKALAGDVYMEAARTGVQLRGGIGFTWEEDTQLWFKRAKSSEVFMGAPHVHRERMMQMMMKSETA